MGIWPHHLWKCIRVVLSMLPYLNNGRLKRRRLTYTDPNLYQEYNKMGNLTYHMTMLLHFT